MQITTSQTETHDALPTTFNFFILTAYERCHLCSKTDPLISHNQQSLGKLAILTYLSSGIKLPAKLRWPGINAIYHRALPSYQPVQPLAGIGKAIIIHEQRAHNHAQPYLQTWIECFTDAVDTHYINSRHLIDEAYASQWLQVLMETL